MAPNNIFNYKKKNEIKNQMQRKTACTKTRCRSETFLNKVAHENVRVYMNQYVKNRIGLSGWI